MADEKMRMVDELQSRPKPWMAMSLFLMSLLVCGSVAAVIFISVQQGDVKCAQEKTTSYGTGPKLTANVDVEVDGQRKTEKVEYHDGDKVTIVRVENGFTVTDHKKGIAYMRGAEPDTCYAFAVGGGESSAAKVKSFLEKYHSDGVHGEVSNYTINVLPGYIEDKSFIPQEAKDECRKFQWTTQSQDGAEARTVQRFGRGRRAVPVVKSCVCVLGVCACVTVG